MQMGWVWGRSCLTQMWSSDAGQGESCLALTGSTSPDVAPALFPTLPRPQLFTSLLPILSPGRTSNFSSFLSNYNFSR